MTSTPAVTPAARVLLVEDDPEAARFAVHVLGMKAGFDVTHTTNPRYASGAAVAEVTGLAYIANVQVRRDQAGQPALLEVNPRALGSLALTFASGVDMPRLAMDVLRGHWVPEHADFREIAMVRFLDERVVEIGEIKRAAA